MYQHVQLVMLFLYNSAIYDSILYLWTDDQTGIIKQTFLKPVKVQSCQ